MINAVACGRLADAFCEDAGYPCSLEDSMPLLEPLRRKEQPQPSSPLKGGDDEPRILNTQLAEALGYVVPAQVLRLIASHDGAWQELGLLVTATGKTGRCPATAYCLNEEQALLVSSPSRTERAKEVRAMLIQVFVAYRRGQLIQAPQFRLPQTFAEALHLAADSEEARVAAEAARVGVAELE
ncbi:hypothetical protein [Azospirillum argentinense]